MYIVWVCSWSTFVDCVWNVTAHAQKPDFVFRRNGRVHLNQRGASVQSTTGSRGVRISGSNAGYTMFRGSVKSTGYPFHSPVSPSLPLPYVTESHHSSTGLYHIPHLQIHLSVVNRHQDETYRQFSRGCHLVTSHLTHLLGLPLQEGAWTSLQDLTVSGASITPLLQVRTLVSGMMLIPSFVAVAQKLLNWDKTYRQHADLRRLF